MSTTVKIVVRFGECFGIKNVSGDMNFNMLVGYVRAKWNELYIHNMVLSCKVLDDGEGMLTDDDDVAHMFSLIDELKLEQIELIVKKREGVVVHSGGNLFIHENLPALDYGMPIVSSADPRISNGGTTPLLSCLWATLMKDGGQCFQGCAKEFRMSRCKTYTRAIQ
ncbi:hypothetical protein ABFS83_03G025000 [Erythranthe nasuta]